MLNQGEPGGEGMGRVKSFLRFLVMIVLSVLTACAPTTLKSVWKDDSYRQGHLKKILIIGVDRNETVKKLLEDEFSVQLKAGGTEVFQSHRIFSEEEMFDKRVIAAKVRELQIDALLIATLKDVADTGIYETYPSFAGEGGGYYGYYLQCCQIVSIGRNVVIETRLFDAKLDRMIWSAVTETIYEGSAEMVIRSYIPVIIAELHRNTVLQ
jgi:hypothetical protein